QAVTSAALFLSGIAGVVAARIGAGPSVKEADQTVREAMAAGSPVSIFSQGLGVRGEGLASDPSPLTPNPSPLATSFVGFLIENSGPGALSKFLAAYDPDRRDQAAAAAFQRPLGALEETWLMGLKRR